MRSMSELKDSSLQRAFAHVDISAPVTPLRLYFPCVSVKAADSLDLKEETEEVYKIPSSHQSLEGKKHLWGCLRFMHVASRKNVNKMSRIFVHEAQQGGRKSAKQPLNHGYSRPPLWKRIFRKLRAETKQVRIACCEGVCWPIEVVHYNTFNYEKNFDQGREHWQQYDRIGGKTSSGYFRKEATESEVDLKHSLPCLVNEVGNEGTSLWRRQKKFSSSELHVKSVRFTD